MEQTEEQQIQEITKVLHKIIDSESTKNNTFRNNTFWNNNRLVYPNGKLNIPSIQPKFPQTFLMGKRTEKNQ
jgi:hypothetical protein